ncbi:MAG TPA: hypothetical protein VI583_09445 [Cyclobacteriaceae bacterium]|nr:hypothetical protein [Cyclobacteriaceae bacterium]
MKKITNQHPGPMRPILVITVMFVLFSVVYLPCFSASGAKKPNFSGTWVLNESRSDFGEYGRYWAPNKLIIVQKGKKLTIERYAPGPSGEETSFKAKYTMDGKECENSVPDQFKSITRINWLEDNKGFKSDSKINMPFQGQEMEIQSIEIYKFDEEGKSLVIESTAINEYGEFKVTFVLDKE